MKNNGTVDGTEVDLHSNPLGTVIVSNPIRRIDSSTVYDATLLSGYGAIESQRFRQRRTSIRSVYDRHYAAVPFRSVDMEYSHSEI